MTAHQPIVEARPLKLRITDVETLSRAGAFEPYHKVELIGGVLYAMNAEYRRHNVVKNRLSRLLSRALERLDSPFEAWTEGTLSLSDMDLPQPDIIVGRGEPDERYYELRDLGFVVEVADSTAGVDRGAKREQYARFGVPELWVIDVREGRLHRFWQPHDGAYRIEAPIPLAGELRSLTITDLVIDGTGIL